MQPNTTDARQAGGWNADSVHAACLAFILTPDKRSGLGDWTGEQFIKTMRTGKHLGTGRPVLPPMPTQNLAGLTDQDLRAVFAYLHSLKPVENQVPAPVPPK